MIYRYMQHTSNQPYTYTTQVTCDKNIESKIVSTFKANGNSVKKIVLINFF